MKLWRSARFRASAQRNLKLELPLSNHRQGHADNCCHLRDSSCQFNNRNDHDTRVPGTGYITQGIRAYYSSHIQAPLGKSVTLTYKYDQASRLLSATDPSGATTQCSYDNLGLVIGSSASKSYRIYSNDSLLQARSDRHDLYHNDQIAPAATHPYAKKV